MAETLHGRNSADTVGQRSFEARDPAWRKSERHVCQPVEPSHIRKFTLVQPSPADEPFDLFVRERAENVAGFDYKAEEFLAVLTAQGIVETEAVLDLLTRVARLLGDMWTEDSCTFNDVTIGMHRLTLLLIGLEPFGTDPDATPRHGGRAFLAPAPGDQHGFGLAMVGYYLRRGGWDVSAELDAQEDRLIAHIASRHYDVIGFSVGHERAVDAVAVLIGRIRPRSRNRGLGVMVGGPMIVADPSLAATMGADLWAADAASLVDRLAPYIPA